MDALLEALLDSINDCGTLMNERELRELAYGVYGKTKWVEDAEGNIIDIERVYTREGLQEIADIYTDGFDVMNW